jgi:hypothetical protein
MNLRFLNPQFFIGSRVGDAALENELERQVKSYDHMLGVLLEAVKVLAAAVPVDSLTPADRLALERLKGLGPVATLSATPHHNALPSGADGTAKSPDEASSPS